MDGPAVTDVRDEVRDEAAGFPSRRLAWSTAIFSAFTGLSRILGLVREIVARSYFGVEGVGINAFTVAFQVPNLVRALVADAALSSAFVPVFSELLEKGEKARAWRVASSLIWILLLGLTAITALFILAAPWVMSLFGYGSGPAGDLAVTLSRILFPIVVLLGIFGVIVGILNSYEHFSIPALTPVFWNLVIIAGLVIGVPQADSVDTKLYIYAGSIVFATLVQLLPLPWLTGLDGRLRLAIDWRDPAVKRVFVLMLPVTLGLGLINVNALIGTFFAARYIDKTIAPSAIDAAFRIYMVPQGMFSVAVATVLFPALSRLAARRDDDAFRHTVGLGLRQIAFLLVPASVAIAVLAEPIVRLLYQRGEFGPHATRVVAGALAAFSIGLTFNGAMLMLNRAFFGLQAPWIPTWVAFGNLLVNTAFFALLYHLGTWGIPLAISLANIAGTAALLILLRRRFGRIEGAETARTAALVTLASLPLALVAYGVWWGLDEVFGRSFFAQVLSVSAALAAGAVVYLFFCRLLGVRELNALLSLRARARPPA
ncbi:MAG TPA: murein biosynthesis integral membrane protein MurJ [Gaiellaceae bacterium]|nr:murein biosynthesis integral membrane protein MurJ [Gaiellaceae bacterium]